MRDLISIIIPAYNVANEIKQCADSIMNQSYQNMEIVFVDDGSNDNTPEILDDIASRDCRIKVIHKENGGVTSARLRGVKEATGDYIGFVDGDDFIEPDMFERLINNAVQYSADISHCGYQMVFHNRRDLYYGTGRFVEQDNLAGLKDLLEGSFIEPGLWNKLFHKTLFRSLLHNSLMDGTIHNNEDLLMNYYLFKQSKKAIFEDFCPYHYIVRESSAANKPLNEYQLLDPIRVTKILLKDTENIPELQTIVQTKYVRQLITLASMRLKANPELIEPNRRSARKELRRRLPEILAGKGFGIKLKGMALITGVCPTAYQIIHMIYARVTGLDKIYDLE